MNDQKMWPPPWLMFPQLECGSMGWRMGAGEAFLEDRMPWWSALAPEEREAYHRLFPAPLPWQRRSEDRELMLRQGKLVLPLWQPDGRPRYDRRWAINAEAACELPAVLPFWGHTPAKDGSTTKACFSQWWKSGFVFGGVEYSCMEQCMMAGKALLFEDMDSYKAIMAEADPKSIKKLGRRVTPFDCAVWDRMKHSLILNGNYSKFTQNDALRQFLLSTGDSLLVEASPYDTIWGIGLGPDHPDVQHPGKWRGGNLLGFALMEVRDEIRRVYAHADACREILENWR